MIGHKSIVGHVRDLPGGIGIIIPDCAVEDVVVARTVVGGQRDDGSGRRHKCYVQVGGKCMRDERGEIQIVEERARAADNQR